MHPLHILVGKILVAAKLAGCKVILGNDCGGRQFIQLFCNGHAAFATRLCSVDAIIVKNGQVIAIIEIEESDIRPVALCGKVFVSAMTANFIHQGTCYPIAPHVSFVQIIDTRKLSKRSSKPAQCENLAEAIKHVVWPNGRDMAYKIFHGNIAEFERPEAQKELQEHLRAACSTHDAVEEFLCTPAITSLRQ